MVEILHSFVHEAVAEADAQDKLEGRKFDFLDELRSRCVDADEVTDQIPDLLAAGRDTTASLLSWVFYCLIRGERVMKRLKDTVVETFGFDHSAVTFEMIKGCNSLQHVLNETLRLHSLVPFNSRRAIRDTILPTGGGPDGSAQAFVNAGSEVNFSTHVFHRRPDLWGPDADQFVPERWEKIETRMVLSAIQRRSSYLYRTAVCAHWGGIRCRQNAARIRTNRRS